MLCITCWRRPFQHWSNYNVFRCAKLLAWFLRSSLRCNLLPFVSCLVSEVWHPHSFVSHKLHYGFSVRSSRTACVCINWVCWGCNKNDFIVDVLCFQSDQWIRWSALCLGPQTLRLLHEVEQSFEQVSPEESFPLSRTSCVHGKLNDKSSLSSQGFHHQFLKGCINLISKWLWKVYSRRVEYSRAGLESFH